MGKGNRKSVEQRLAKLEADMATINRNMMRIIEIIKINAPQSVADPQKANAVGRTIPMKALRKPDVKGFQSLRGTVMDETGAGEKK